MAWRSAPVDKPVIWKTTRNRGCSEERLTKSVDTPEQLSSCVLLQSVGVQIRHKSPTQLRVYCTLKRSAGFGWATKNHPLSSAKFCRRTSVIRIGHGSTVPYGEYPVIGLHYLEVVGCSKLSVYNPRKSFVYKGLGLRARPPRFCQPLKYIFFLLKFYLTSVDNILY